MLSLSIFYNPFILLFTTIVAGLLLGKVKFGRLKLGSSGTLFAGLIIGYFVVKSITGTDDLSADAELIIQTGKIIDKRLFTMALIFFVSAVGLQAGKNIGTVIKKYGVKFVALGIIITAIGAGGAYVSSIVVEDANVYTASGVYTGALTSSPGLASAIESADNHIQQTEGFDGLSEQEQHRYIKTAEEQVGMGYAVGYPFGVIVVILAMNLFPIIFKIDVRRELELYQNEMKHDDSEAAKEDGFDVIGCSLVCLGGYILGMIKIPLGFLGTMSLEVTGGVLIMSLALSYVGKIGRLSFRMNDKILDVIRETAVIFFLAIVGLNYGYGAITALADKGIMLAISAAVIALIAILSGFVIGKYVFKINWIMLSGGLCGGMTSTPGLGAAIEATGSEGPAGGYGAAYPFALIGMILFTIVLYQLPII